MQHVEVLRLLAGVQRGGDRIDDRFDRAVAEREDERPDVQQRKAVPLPCENGFRARAGIGEQERRRERDDRREHVQRERDRHRHAVAQTVDDEAEQDDRDREREQTGAQQISNLFLTEIELRAPLLEDRRAHGKAERRGDEGDDTACEEPCAVDRVRHGCSRVSASSRIRAVGAAFPVRWSYGVTCMMPFITRQ